MIGPTIMVSIISAASTHDILLEPEKCANITFGFLVLIHLKPE